MDTRRPPGRPPIAGDIAAGLSRLRSELAEGFLEPPPDRPLMKRPKDRPWPSLPPADALDAGVPFQEILRQGVREALFRSLADGVYLPIRAALTSPILAAAAARKPPPPVGVGPVEQPGVTISGRPPQVAAGGALAVGWYGNQDAAWIGHLDVLHRLKIVAGGHNPAFDVWVTLARAGGWWWPGERVCVLAERPAVIHIEPVPGAWHGEVRLRREPGIPAIAYRDGWPI